MTSKTPSQDKTYAWQKAKELCSEVNLSGPESEIPLALLAKMHLDPKSVSRIDPPPGYEDRLVAALMAKAEKVQAPMHAPRAGGEQPWFRLASKLIPITGLSFALLAAVALFQYFSKSSTSVAPAGGDLWAKAVENASTKEVSRWLASVSDVGSQSLTTATDMAVLGSEMNEVQLERALKEDGGS